MIRFKLFISIFTIFYSIESYGTNIAVINLEKIINENLNYINIIKDLEKSQQKYFENFKIIENEISNLSNEIENSKLLLDDNENIKLVNEYNIKLDNYKKLAEEFNTHYQNQIISIRKTILEEIIVLLEIYAKDNNLDLIMDASNYLIASNSINITNIIEKKLNEKTLILEFLDFEKN